MVFCDWLPLLMLIHIVTCVSISFLFLWWNNILLYEYPHFVYPFISWWTFWDFFFFLSNAAMNIHAQIFMWTYVFISLCYKSFLGHMITLCLTFWWTPRLLFKVAPPFDILTSNLWDLQFLHILAKICFFDCSHPRGWKWLFHCDFDLQFSHS